MKSYNEELFQNLEGSDDDLRSQNIRLHKLAQLETLVIGQHGIIENYKNAQNSFEAERKAHAAETDHLGSQIIQLRELTNEQSRKLDQHEVRIKALDIENEDLKSRNEKLTSLLQNLEGKSDDDLRSQNIQLHKLANEKSRKLDQLKTLVTGQHEIIENYKNAQNSFEAEREAHAAEVDRLKSQNIQLHKLADEKSRKLDQLKTLVTGQHEIIENYKNAQNSFEAEREAHAAEIKRLEQIHKEVNEQLQKEISLITNSWFNTPGTRVQGDHVFLQRQGPQSFLNQQRLTQLKRR